MYRTQLDGSGLWPICDTNSNDILPCSGCIVHSWMGLACGRSVIQIPTTFCRVLASWFVSSDDLERRLEWVSPAVADQFHSSATTRWLPAMTTHNTFCPVSYCMVLPSVVFTGIILIFFSHACQSVVAAIDVPATWLHSTVPGRKVFWHFSFLSKNK